MYRNTALLIATIAALVIIIASSTPSYAQANSVTANFQRVGSGESLTAPFTNIAGTPTIGSYGGLTEIIVSGTGNALGPTVSDAFYFLDGSATGIYYGMNIGYSGLPFAGGQANNVQQRMYFIDGMGDVPLNTIPGYAVNHTYHFVLDLPASAGVLSFGASDGAYVDNGGAYNISVFPVVRSMVPETGTLALALPALGMVGVVVIRLCKK